MLNILSWAEVASHFRITSDSAIDDCIFVHISDGISIHFTNLDDGIYLLDQKNMHKIKSFTSYSYANIVDENKLDFTSRELEGVDTAKSLFRAMGFLSYSRFIYAIEHNLIPNCTVTIPDVCCALHIYGPELATIKGKTTRKKPSPLPASAYTPIPKSILDHHQHATLAVDFFM
jgi:hypothetical protein